MDMIPVNRPLINDSDKLAVIEALDQTWISGEAPPIKFLEENLARYVGVEHAVAVSTGTTALDLAVEVLDIKPGDECIVPTFTITSTVNALLRKQAKVLLVDADESTWSMNSRVAAEHIGKKTRLIVPVHIYGLPVDLDPIMSRALQYEVNVLEDAAEALGVSYKEKKCGSIGTMGMFSFFANKVVTGGEGGAITTNSLEIATKLRRIRNLSHSNEERFVHSELSWNARMPALVAALINSQLLRIDFLLQAKRNIAERYLEGLKGHPWIIFMPESISYSRNAFWVFPILLNDDAPVNAKAFQEILSSHGVDTRRFFCPIHLQPYSNKYPVQVTGDMSVSEKLWERGVYLPSGMGISDSEVDQVISILWKIART